MKRKLSLLLAAVMLLGLLSGCAGIQKNPYKDDPDLANEILNPSPSPSTSPITDINSIHNFAGAYAEYDPGFVVATVNDIDVTWGEYFYWCMNALMEVESYVGQLEDLNADFGGMSYADFIKAAAENNSRQYRAIDYYASKEGIELSEEALAAIKAQVESDVASVSEDGTEEGLYKYLESSYISRDTYDYVNRIASLFSDTFVHFYGAECEKITEDQIAGFAERNVVLAAKHILLKTVGEDGSTKLTDDEQAAQLELAKALIGRIEAGEDFDTLMAEYNQDPGSASYPDGYCFGENQMVAEFENATKALNPGEITKEPVESSFGYHIIMRVPLKADMVYMGQNGSTVRQITASEDFSLLVNEWLEDSEIKYTEGFEIDINELFKAQ